MYRADNWVIPVLLILFGINGSLVSFVGYVTYQERESLHLNKASITEFPVPCEDLSLSADEDCLTFDVKKGDLRTFIDHAGKYICSKDNATETVQTVVEREARFRLAKGLDEQYLSCGNESLAEKSGYLTVFFSEISKHQNLSGVSSDTKLRWNQHSANCHIDPSVYYDKGEVITPEGRTYFVYASAHFNISRQGENGIKNFGRPRKFSIRICKSVYGYEQTLLGRRALFNTTKTENVVSSLRIGSHLELSRNDKIYVRVSNADMMIHNSTGNNFGLFPL
ncbi:uncharacterized protein LOC123554551 [Mercenaria mercenaria]|uniref:uncharacterized protein LOC123554551 n=1 Tax=Mercenaria mercenaria TaxID=6596 RepID=UPI00234F2280|nr:uncharacterized protein LOC123554551 [Mercenaria mercenaria]XP_053404001.1 uncharacterized protein LOC123554551 [Mercenaria mercenaria]